MRGVFGENTQLNPDIEVYNSPEDFCLSLWERRMRPAGADGEGKDADRRLTLC